MKTCSIGQPAKTKKSEFPWRRSWQLFFFGMGVTTAIWFIQFERGRTAEYESMKARDAASFTRAKVAEDQLALTLKSGDCGILLWNIDPDLGPSQLRLLQVAKRKEL